MIHVCCPECDDRLEDDIAVAGDAVACPFCGKPFLMPKMVLPVAKPALEEARPAGNNTDEIQRTPAVASSAPKTDYLPKEQVPRAEVFVAPDYFQVVGWLLVGLGGFPALASFYVGGGDWHRYPEEAFFGGLLAVALNPLVWLGGLLGWFMLKRASLSGIVCRCPHCRRVGAHPGGHSRAKNSLVMCPRCNRKFFWAGACDEEKQNREGLTTTRQTPASVVKPSPIPSNEPVLSHSRVPQTPEEEPKNNPDQPVGTGDRVSSGKDAQSPASGSSWTPLEVLGVIIILSLPIVMLAIVVVVGCR